MRVLSRETGATFGCRLSVAPFPALGGKVCCCLPVRASKRCGGITQPFSKVARLGSPTAHMRTGAHLLLCHCAYVSASHVSIPTATYDSTLRRQACRDGQIGLVRSFVPSGSSNCSLPSISAQAWPSKRARPRVKQHVIRSRPDCRHAGVESRSRLSAAPSSVVAPISVELRAATPFYGSEGPKLKQDLCPCAKGILPATSVHPPKRL